MAYKDQIATSLQEWLILDTKIKTHQTELNQLYTRRKKIEETMRGIVETNGLQNSKIKMNGETFYIRITNLYAGITHKFLQAVLTRIFSKGVPQSADHLMATILMERPVQQDFSISKH